MKLRNKRTGRVVNFRSIMFDEPKDDRENYRYSSLVEFNEEWEDVEDTNDTNMPLIKNDKIRRAVRAWAELCGIDRCYFEHNEGSFASKWYVISLPASKHGEDIESGTYTIAELCGERDDFGGKDVRHQNPLAELSPYDYSKRNIVTDHTEPCGEEEE